MKKIFIHLSMILITFSAWGQDTSFGSYDKDTNSLLSLEEFDLMLQDRDMYKKWDVDKNGLISLNEWTDGIALYYPAYQQNGYNGYLNWDMNSDHFLGKLEFRAGHFTLWDLNLDQRIDEEEWAMYTRWRDIDAKTALSSTTGF